jgi:hypothetical protein
VNATPVKRRAVECKPIFRSSSLEVVGETHRLFPPRTSLLRWEVFRDARQ